jgi:hypothetical protein
LPPSSSARIGIARSSPIPALAGVVFALFMVYVPTIIDLDHDRRDRTGRVP